MPVTKDRPAPYAPASAILSLIDRHRNKGLPAPVDGDVLARAGISASLIPRTLQAMQSLDLIDDEGKHTEVLEGIRLAPEAEFKQRLAEWLTGAYADALAYVDPTKDDEIAIRDAFRSYVPVGQQGRMVTLFIGLFTAAGVMPERAKAAPVRKERVAVPVYKPRTAARVAPIARDKAPKHYGGGSLTPSLPPALAGLLESLPRGGEGWTKAEREKFYTTFGAVLDFCVPILTRAEAQEIGNGG